MRYHPITGRPILENADNSFSTEESITVTDPRLNNGQPTNIPSIWDGQRGTEERAIKEALKSGQEFDSFPSIDEAVTAAKKRSDWIGKTRRPKMTGIMDLISQINANTNGPGDILQAPSGMPGASMLNRPAGPDIMALIQMLTGRGGGRDQTMQPLSINAMPYELAGIPPEIVAQMGLGQPIPPPTQANTMRSVPASKPKPKSSKPKIDGNSKGASDNKKKKKTSPRNKMADDMIAADRAGSAVSEFVRR